MVKQPETLFGERVDKDLAPLNCWFFNVNQVTLHGIPDRVGCLNGKFFALELKKDKASARKKTGTIALQRYELKKIVKAGGFAEITYPDIWVETLERLIEYGTKTKFRTDSNRWR